jgi:hypothetical protein
MDAERLDDGSEDAPHPDDDWDSAGEKHFGSDAWGKFKKARDAQRKKKAMDADEPPDFPGKPTRPGGRPVGDAAAMDARFINRFPNAFRIGADDGYGRGIVPAPGHSMSSRDDAGFAARFPGAAKIRSL